MNKHNSLTKLISTLSLTLSIIAVLYAQTIFTYQGYLRKNGAPANGNFDFEFQLTTAPVGGILLGTNIMRNVPVANGLFTVQLDFGDLFLGRIGTWLFVCNRQWVAASQHLRRAYLSIAHLIPFELTSRAA